MQDNTAILFDMDGVLADSQKLHMLAEEDVCAHFGFAVTRAWLEGEAGRPDSMSFTNLVMRAGKPLTLVEEMMTYKYHTALPQILKEQGMPPVDGVEEVVRFAAENFPVAVASSSPRSFIDFLLGKMPFGNLLPERVSNDDVEPGRGKPFPDIYLLAAKKLDVKEEHCIVIEDAAHGVAAAKAAGMRCIGFRNPGSGTQNLSQADWVYGDMKDVLKCLLQFL